MVIRETLRLSAAGATVALLRRDSARMRDNTVVARSSTCRGDATQNALQRQEVVLSDKAVQRGAVDAELLGRKGQISALLMDRFLEELLFKPFEGLSPPFAVAAELPWPFSRQQDRPRKILHGDERPHGIGQGSL